VAALNPQQRRFVDAYLADPRRHARKAAIAAGYSARSAHSTGSRLIRDPAVKAAIAAAERPHRRRYGLTQKRVLREAATLLFSDLADYTHGRDGRLGLSKQAQPRATRAVSAVKRKTRWVRNDKGGYDEETQTEIRLYDKTRVLPLAMKHLGLLVDRVEVKHTEPQTWVIGGRSITF
jgi:phage terminase small subunit